MAYFFGNLKAGGSSFLESVRVLVVLLSHIMYWVILVMNRGNEMAIIEWPELKGIAVII